jgi:hypothetical protein
MCVCVRVYACMRVCLSMCLGHNPPSALPKPKNLNPKPGKPIWSNSAHRTADNNSADTAKSSSWQSGVKERTERERARARARARAREREREMRRERERERERERGRKIDR